MYKYDNCDSTDSFQLSPTLLVPLQFPSPSPPAVSSSHLQLHDGRALQLPPSPGFQLPSAVVPLPLSPVAAAVHAAAVPPQEDVAAPPTTCVFRTHDVQ